MAKPPGDYIPPGGLFKRQASHAPRLQNYFWRSLDRAMPDGPPIFLVFVITSLLVVNGFIAFLRW
jgi:hypothetical protein